MKIDERGRSLVEVSVVMAIIAVFTATAVPQLSSAGTRYRERAVVAEFASELRTARLLALARRERIQARLGGDGRSLDITTAGEAPIVLRRYALPAEGVSVGSWEIDRSIWFHASGHSASPATITLRGTENSQWIITVSITGRITVS